MRGLLLFIWLFAALVVSLLLMACVSPLVGFACLAVNAVLLRLVQASLPGAPQAILPPQVQAADSVEGRAELFVSRMGFDAVDDKVGVALYVDGKEQGA